MKPSSAESTTRYLTGFALALGLTVLAFLLICAQTNSSAWPLHFALAVIQIGVHLRYFLHLDFSPKQKPMLQALLFSLLIIFIVVCGTLWIMHDLDRQMMPL